MNTSPIKSLGLALCVVAIALLGANLYLSLRTKAPDVAWAPAQELAPTSIPTILAVPNKPAWPAIEPYVVASGGNSGTQVQVAKIQKAEAPWLLYRGRPFTKNLGPDQTLQILPVVKECDKGPLKDIELRINQAFLIPTIPDLPKVKFEEMGRNFPDVKVDKFLVFMGFTRNYSKSQVQTQTVYSSYYFRIVRPKTQYPPIVYGGPTIPGATTAIFWAIFPVSESENTFNVNFCDMKNPTKILLDFTSPNVITATGNYSSEEGLYIK